MALKIVTDILHNIATKPEPPPPSHFLHQVQATLNKMKTSFNTHNKKHDNLPIVSLNKGVPLPRVVPLKHTTSDTQILPEKTRCYQHSNLTYFKNNALMQSQLENYKKQLMYHIYNKANGKKETIRSLLNNPATAEIWAQSASNEFG